MAMVMDFLIGFLLLLSAAINILALGAFFVTPSLRSTSNRFVINLLIVNVIGCLILAPSLMFNSNIIRRLYSDEPAVTVIMMGGSDTKSATVKGANNGTTTFNRLEKSSSAFQPLQPSSSPILHPRTAIVANGNGEEINSTLKTKTTMYKIDRKLDLIDANNTPIIIPQSEQQATTTRTNSNGETSKTKDVDEEEELISSLESDTPFHQIRPWILDIIAAIGALSLVLVVGDTYCAVTDPLRYHTRVSASRVFFLILVVWCVALGFGVSSALRTQCIDDITLQHSLYNNIYGTTYFVCIILVPFSLVCAMYWGIIREARKNGLRLRHNGSSPLLQSVLHMDPHQAQLLQIEEEQQLQQQQLQQEQCKKGSTSSDGGKFPVMVAPSKLLENGVVNETNVSDEDNIKEKSPPSELINHASIDSHITNLRRNKSAQQLLGSAVVQCECCETILITRSISNQSAYLNSSSKLLSSASAYLKVPNRDLRNARSTPDLLRQNILGNGGIIGGSRINHGGCSGGGGGVANGIDPLLSLEHHILIAPRPTTTKSLGYMTSIRHRLSNASSLFKYREESRAARISVLVVIMFLVSYIPFGLLVLTEGRNSLLSTYQQTVLAILFVVLVNIMSPLIFAYRNKRVRRGIKRLVSVTGGGGGKGNGGRCGHTKERRKGEAAAGNVINNGSIKELSRHNSSPRKIRRTRGDSSEVTEMKRNGSGNGLDGGDNNNNVEHCGEQQQQRRKLVIFNGKNGQITKVCHSDHHRDFIQLAGNAGSGGLSGSGGIVKGCGGGGGSNKEQPSNLCPWRKEEDAEFSSAAATVIGCPSHSLRLMTSTTAAGTRANHKPKVKSTVTSTPPPQAVVQAPFLRRIKSTSGHIFKRSTAHAATTTTMMTTGQPKVVPEVNIDFPSKPIDV